MSSKPTGTKQVLFIYLFIYFGLNNTGGYCKVSLSDEWCYMEGGRGEGGGNDFTFT